MAVISEIKKKSKNLFNPSKWASGTITEFNGIPCLKVKDTGSTISYLVDGDSSDVYTITIKFYRGSDGDGKISNFYSSVRGALITNAKQDTLYQTTVYGGEKIYFTGWSKDMYIDLTVTQLEKGEVATAFEPYYLDITKYNNETINGIEHKNNKIVGLPNGNYHFAKANEVADGVCENSVNEPLIDMQISGNSIQDGTPTLDAPIEIQSVGVKTKNLVDIPIIDGSIGTKIINCYIDQTISFSCQEYPTLIARDDGTETSIWRIAFKRLDGSTTYAVDSTLQGEGTTLTTVTADNPIIEIEYRSTYIREGAYKGIQIEYGREVTSYEPYGYKLPIIKRGLNLADISQGFYSQYTGISNEVIGNTLKTVCSVASRGGTIDLGTLPVGTYRISVKKFSGVKDNVETPLKMSVQVNGKGINASVREDTNAIFTLTEESVVKLYHAFANSYDYYILEDLMAYKGEEEKEFVPYIEPTTTDIYIKEPLRMINDVADVLDYKNKKVIRNVGSIIFDGNVDWGTYDSGNGYMKTNSIFPDGKPVLCNMFVNSQSLVRTLAIRKNYANIYVYGVVDYYPTRDEWKEFLAQNNMEVIGQLVTPTEEAIEVPEIMTFDGTTTFEIATQLEPSAFSVKYWKQI